MTKTVVLRGTATVSFIKTIRGMDEDEAAELLGDVNFQEGQIDFDDCQELITIENIEAESR